MKTKNFYEGSTHIFDVTLDQTLITCVRPNINLQLKKKHSYGWLPQHIFTSLPHHIFTSSRNPYPNTFYLDY